MEEETTKWTTKEAAAMNLSASLILQNVICKGIDIIKHHGYSRFDLINDAFTSQVGEPPNYTITTEAGKQTVTTAKSTSAKATSATPLDNLVSRRRRTSTDHYEPEVKKTKPQKRLPNKKRVYTEDEAELEKAKITYEDVEFQLKMTHYEYVDLTTRPKNKPLPAHDQEHRSDFKKEKKFWLGYTDTKAKAKVLLPEWINKGVVTEECKTRIFPEKICHGLDNEIQIRNYY